MIGRTLAANSIGGARGVIGLTARLPATVYEPPDDRALSRQPRYLIRRLHDGTIPASRPAERGVEHWGELLRM